MSIRIHSFKLSSERIHGNRREQATDATRRTLERITNTRRLFQLRAVPLGLAGYISRAEVFVYPYVFVARLNNYDALLVFAWATAAKFDNLLRAMKVAVSLAPGRT